VLSTNPVFVLLRSPSMSQGGPPENFGALLVWPGQKFLKKNKKLSRHKNVEKNEFWGQKIFFDFWVAQGPIAQKRKGPCASPEFGAGVNFLYVVDHAYSYF